MVSDSKYEKGMNSIIMQIHHLRGTSKILNKILVLKGWGWGTWVGKLKLWDKVFS